MAAVGKDFRDSVKQAAEALELTRDVRVLEFHREEHEAFLVKVREAEAATR